MKANTRLFGEIDIDEEKIITLENGMIGFPDLRKFTLIFDKEKERTPSSIMWFQSMDEPEIAFPVMHPNEIKPDYAPSVSDEMLTPLGDLTEDNTYILVTLTAAADKKDTTVNLKAPLVINTDTRKGCQVIVEDDYPIKFNVYEAVKDSVTRVTYDASSSMNLYVQSGVNKVSAHVDGFEDQTKKIGDIVEFTSNATQSISKGYI